MHQPLNRTLYAQLEREFGSVKFGNEGVRMSPHHVVQLAGGRLRVRTQEWGEFYRVCCPFCTDTIHRLYVHHLYGKQDETGRNMTFLAMCFNEYCLEDPNNRQELWNRITALVDPRRLRAARVLPGREYVPKPGQLPGECVKLTELPTDHDAIVYLRSRGYDPILMEKVYGVCYCVESRYRFARDRIVFPIWFGGKLMGWQARHVGELPWKQKPKIKGLAPKYWTDPDMHKSQVVFNGDGMKKWRTGVIVEGPLDVVNFGQMSGSTLGASLSEFQVRWFAATFRQPKRSLVLLFDPDVLDNPRLGPRMKEKIATIKQAIPGQFADVWLPEGLDPGSTERESMREFVKQEAAKQGVEVHYEKFDENRSQNGRPRQTRLSSRTT